MILKMEVKKKKMVRKMMMMTTMMMMMRKKEKSLIVEGKREKKKVERLCIEMSVVKKEPVLTEGKGQKLYDIERIQFFLKKKKCEELRLLHRLLFNRLGTVNMVKKNIGQFNGFPFEKGSEQYKKKEDMLKRLKKDDLKNICGVLDLEKSGVNSELISKIMKFLMEPKSTGKALPKSKPKTPKGGKKERSSSGSARKSKSRKANVILTDESSSEEEKKEKEESSDEKESEEEVEEEEQEDDEEPPKKVVKKEKSKPKTASKSKKSANSSNIKKADSSTTNKSTKSSKKDESESEDDSSDDEPLIKKVNKPPTDDDLRETIKKLLAEANLEEVTMKQICKKVSEGYPNCDLSSRKKFIKATVTELLS
ncbi:protein DEK isoform X2 [Engystomops pustulosus]|uniref:protein DEK isoform X2 n=1 Tax=Engystomops pustulosus TaxID=76066 RepID=UPI003AFA5540